MASFKGGYDYEFVEPPPKSLECSICLLTLRDPHVISCCGNHFCHSCISHIQGDGKPCPLCNEPNFTTFLHKGVVREVKALTIHCTQKSMGCDWKGELGQLEQHLNPGAGSVERGCGFVMVGCVYRCGGHIQRQQIRDHEIHCPRRPMEVQMAYVMKRLNELTVKNKAIENEVQELKAENSQLKASIAKLEIHCPPAPVPPFYFTLLNYEHYTMANYRWCSPPFYSHPGGYKMRCNIFPNGEAQGTNSHLSCYVGILRGEYDDKLQWPFRGKINVEMFNIKSDKWVQMMNRSFKEDDPPECWQRPIDRLGTATLGHTKLIKLKDLERDYVSNTDMIRFRIVSVQLT